jgi:hypothetical protein
MKTIMQDPRWPEAHIGLRKLYEERVPSGMTQGQFGARYNIGTQGMVWQYLNGHRPLNVEAAAKFARGLRCTINDISPEMAAALQRDLLPVLGPKMLRAALAKAALVLVAVGLAPSPFPAQADDFSTKTSPAYYVKRRWWLILGGWLPGFAAA